MGNNLYELEVKAYKYKHILNNLVSKGNNTYTYTGTYKECLSMQKRLARKRIYGEVYKKSCTRSTTYRNTFFKETGNKNYYRCVYCGKLLPRYKTTIDHVIPIVKVKHSSFARLLLRIRKCQSVNDIKNLVPSCKKCNNSKGMTLNLIYLLRARFGSNSLYWTIVWLLKVVFVVGLCLVVYMIYIKPEILVLITSQILSVLKKISQIFI